MFAGSDYNVHPYLKYRAAALFHYPKHRAQVSAGNRASGSPVRGLQEACGLHPQEKGLRFYHLKVRNTGNRKTPGVKSLCESATQQDSIGLQLHPARRKENSEMNCSAEERLPADGRKM